MDMLTHPAIAGAEQTCEACPDQWEGELTREATRTAQGRAAFYFRYRHGIASLAIGPDRAGVAGITRPAQAFGDVKCEYIKHGDNLRGAFDSDDERSRVFARLFDLATGR